MLELLKKELGIQEASVRVKLKNGRTMYGVITNLLPGINIPGHIRFFPNETGSNGCSGEMMLLPEENVDGIDLYLK
jgi:hypothetical protein